MQSKTVDFRKTASVKAHGGELFAVEAGHARCSHSTLLGPSVPNRYILHYVIGGSGSYCGIPLGRGFGYVTVPGEVHSFKSDAGEPFEHVWLAMDGNGAAAMLEKSGIAPQNSVFECPFADRAAALIDGAIEAESSDVYFPYFVLGTVYQLLSMHRGGKGTTVTAPMRRDYVRRAVEYIRTHYHEDIGVGDIAREANLSVTHLCRVFSAQLGSSPKRLLTETRIEAAKTLLLGSTMTVGEVARSVGYRDALYFSQVFRRHCGAAPSEFRTSSGKCGL